MPEPTTRPGHAYLDAVLIQLPWGGHRFYDVANYLPDGTAPSVLAPELVADVLEAVARMGLLRGEEHRHDLTTEEADQLIVWLRPLCGHARYGPGGHTIRNRYDLEFVVTHALARVGQDTDLRERILIAQEALGRWLEARETKNAPTGR